MADPLGLVLPDTSRVFGSSAGTNPSFTAFAIAASNSSLEFILLMEEVVTITELWVRPNTVTGAQPVYEVRLEGASATTGRADGTVKGATNNAKATIASMTGGTSQWLTLGESYTTTRGELLAIKIAYLSGTVDGSNNVSFSYRVASAGDDFTPQVWLVTAGAGATSNSGHACYGYASATKSYGFPVETVATNITISTTVEEALAFTLPTALYGVGTTYTVKALIAHLRTVPGTGANGYTIKLYDSDLTTVLQNATYDTDVVGVGSAERFARLPFDEVTLNTLTAGTKYYASILTSSATTCTVFRWDFRRAQDLDCLPGGRTFYLVTGNSSAWTEVTTGRPSLDLVLGDVTLASGGGGGPLIGPGRLSRN